MTILKWLPSIGVAALLVFAVAYLLGTFAGVANQAWIFGGALAFPLVCTLLGFAGAVILLLVATVRPLRTRANLLSTASAGLVAGIVALALILTTPSLASPDSVPAREDAGELRALAWNVHQEDVPAEALVDLMAKTEPDVVMFAELYSGGDEARFPGGRYPTGYQLIDGHAIAVTLFVSEHLGEYRLVAADDDSGAYTGIVAEPVDPVSDSPKIVAVHTTRMSLNPDLGAGSWQHGLDWIAQHCAEPNTIALGDFNAGPANFTDDRLGQCQLHSLGTSAPTWPSTVAVPLGATIDHVLATPDWTPTYARTLDVPASGTDHRPVFSVLTR